MSADYLNAGGNVLSTVIGGIFGYHSNKKSNETNLQIARETNEAQREMMREQNMFSRLQAERQNEYNSAFAQRARLEAAGYNPASLIGYNSLPAASAPAASTPQLQRAEVRPFDASPYLAILGQNVSAFASARKANAEANGQEIDNNTRHAQNLALINMLEKSGQLSHEQAEQYRLDNMIKEMNFDSYSKLVQQQLYETSEKARMLKLQNNLTEEYGDAIKQGEIAKTAEEVKKLVEEQKTEQAKRVLMKIQGDVQKAQTIINREVAGSVIRLNLANANKAELENSVYKVFGESKAAAEFLGMVYSNDSRKLENWLNDNSKYADLVNRWVSMVRNSIGIVDDTKNLFNPFSVFKGK